jgi:Kef-type K+ transport system membrane component KefB
MDQVNTINLIAVAVAMAIAAAIPALLPRLPLPGVVLEIVIGAIVGPQVLGMVHPGSTLNFMADFGLGMVFLMAGFEMNPAVLRGRPIRNALFGWALTLVIAFGAAMLLKIAGLASAPSLTGLALTTTAIGTLLPMLRDARLLSPPYGPMVLAAGAMGEVGPVIALSLILAQGRALEQAMVMIAFAATAAGAVIFARRASTGSFAGIVERTIVTSGQLPMRLAICSLILLVVLSEQLRIDMVIGAFVAGALMRAVLQRHHDEAMSARLDGVGSAFLVPIFFVTSGVRLDVASLFSDPVVLMMAPLYAALMLVARGLPALLLYRSDLSFRQRIGLAFHSGTQLSLVVAITGIAVGHELMPGAQGAALVGGGILTMMLFPALARRCLREQLVARALAETSGLSHSN